jgi:hypothetical protein
MKKESTFESTKDKREQFLKELKALLVKFDAELVIEDLGYNEETIVVDFNYDGSFFEKEQTGVIQQLILGRYFDGK